jgi:coproporphyrinogen III oxidase-like Fe-S oxidoreductase
MTKEVQIQMTKMYSGVVIDSSFVIRHLNLLSIFPAFPFNFSQMSFGSDNRISSLYVHVPFCAQKCSYCAFYSEASSGELIERYTNALIREFELVAHDLKPATVFFGGGTPSILNLKQWRSVLEAMQRLNLLGAAEWTIESNPATVSLDKAKLWRDFGVNRVSMGVQSLDEDLLDRLGRVHSRDMVFKSFDILRRAGFDNINLDLMFAIPGQTMAVWEQNTRRSHRPRQRTPLLLRSDLRGRHAALQATRRR